MYLIWIFNLFYTYNNILTLNTNISNISFNVFINFTDPSKYSRPFFGSALIWRFSKIWTVLEIFKFAFIFKIPVCQLWLYNTYKTYKEQEKYDNVLKPYFYFTINILFPGGVSLSCHFYIQSNEIYDTKWKQQTYHWQFGNPSQWKFCAGPSQYEPERFPELVCSIHTWEHEFLRNVPYLFRLIYQH